jgi:TRAP-type mannitol/chloroaromatic compound transport system substrate-binding protein
MERRSFLKGATLAGAAGAATLASSFPKPAIAQGRMEWRMVTAWPKGMPGVGTGAQKLADRVTAMTDGRLTVKVFAAGELVPGLQCFDAVSNGTAELGHDASYYHLGKSKACAFFTAFPFGLTAAEQTAWINYGGGQQLWEELYAPFNLQPLLFGNTGTQTFGWFRKEINSLEDLKGLKFRTPGINAEILTKLGATVMLTPGGEIFPNLQSGALDGAEWVGPYNDLSFGFYQVAPYYYAPGFQEPCASLELLVNKQKFEELPKDLQEILRVAGQAGHDDIIAEYYANNGPSLQTLVTKHGVKLRQLPRDVLMAAGNATNEILGDMMGNGDAITKKIIDSYLGFRSQIMPWTRVGEQAFYEARMLPFPHNGKKA